MTGLQRIITGRDGQTPDRPVLIGAVISVLWLLLVVAFWLFGPEGSPRSGLERLLTAVGILLPLGLIWLAVGMAQTIAALRDQADILRRAAQGRTAIPPETTRAAMAGANAPTAAQPQAAAPASMPARGAVKAALRPQPRDTRQSAMPLDPPEPTVQVTPDQLVAALNFPDGPEDHTAITALRAALKDPEQARLIRAAQDVITLLADRGVYMDYLDSMPADPALWRRFAAGERGGDITGLNVAHDETTLETVSRMRREDDVFRDAIHHFLRHFDRMLTATTPRLEDGQIAALTDTRSGRAFGLLGQVVGIFA